LSHTHIIPFNAVVQAALTLAAEQVDLITHPPPLLVVQFVK